MSRSNSWTSLRRGHHSGILGGQDAAARRAALLSNSFIRHPFFENQPRFCLSTRWCPRYNLVAPLPVLSNRSGNAWVINL